MWIDTSDELTKLIYNIQHMNNNQSFIVKLIIKAGLAKDEKSAQPVMLAIAALALVVMFIFWPR